MKTETPHIIYTESTPNPGVMKFVSNKLLTKKTQEFFKVEDTKGWPLIAEIFSFPFIQEIFIATNYISIKKIDSIDWSDVSNQIRIFIQDKLNNNIKVCEINNHPKSQNKKYKKTKLMIDIEEVINTSIRPNIQMDGGDIELVSCKDGVVELFLKGACSGCPSSQMTLKSGIEVLLKEKFPKKIKEVIAINT